MKEPEDISAPFERSGGAVVEEATEGATSGIGLETARALYQRGYHVVLACRDTAKCGKVVEELAAEGEQAVSPGSAECMVRVAFYQFPSVDLTSLQSVRDFAEEFKQKRQPLHLLINNAGIYSPPYGETKDGFESQFGVNYLSHFLLTFVHHREAL
ncbi:shortchain dehydrogenase/reductase SDR, putative [Acanthamoeba castellanii str. Neff]|uniref:Shortchain dehydrogenase/reductase SDR, putative n=1 Tax=Acanthamoeba castellanii (strain ATCC 30010 / Neff) TaxID=1257118 RepID=L8GTY1_ACACF|nr:shortchain dehydrogenase/reductase SDR, putative [Acanthamoeba castellanii str. Neff]ELR16609.1 shortchain dehydrogenase/reductase SDR, putative [Acanthamoeba castellanii str. Neff]